MKKGLVCLNETVRVTIPNTLSQMYAITILGKLDIFPMKAQN